MKLLHVINPVLVGESSDLFVAQPVTFESMRVAKATAAFFDSGLAIELLATCYPEDVAIVPDYFSVDTSLTRSVLDLKTFEKNKKLPLLIDILTAAYRHAPDADFILYTNVDIAVMPSFYTFIAAKIRNGVDAMVINRRTIPKEFTKVNELPLMYSLIGESHPGYDCFIFKRSIVPSLCLHNIIVGARKVGLALYLNLRCFSKAFEELDAIHATFHIGDDKAWNNKMYNEFFAHNQSEYRKVFEDLKKLDKPVAQFEQGAFRSIKKRSKNVFLRLIRSFGSLKSKS
jgi:hypothetical protein